MPANIQGLNIVQPQQASSDSQDLLSGQTFPDISAQLDLWTNLSFDNEEASLSRNDEEMYNKSVEEDEEDVTSPVTPSGEKAIHDGHVNVVTATNLGTNLTSKLPQPAAGHSVPPQLPAFDINTLLSGFGIDPFTNLSQQPNGAIAPSLAQLLALHSHAPSFPSAISPSFSHHPAQPTAAFARLPQLGLTAHSSPTTSTSTITTEETSAKRPRTRKASISNAGSPEGMPQDGHGMTLAAAEDKRRRNTAASARFRLKKKEREAALEGKAKELEMRVNELERECEGLRRENGWLKGLVVGVTGAAQAPVVPTPPSSLSASHLASITSATTGSKRSRNKLDNQ